MTDDARRREALRQIQPYIESARRFSGWTFDVQVRPLGDDPPWDYEALARERAGAARCVLDLGTGGGEVLSRVIEGSAARVVASEHWVVNAPIARDRLAPLGVDVVRAGVHLPCASGSFDLVLSRHEELDPAEIDRVLAPGGRLLTQQVGRDNWDEVRAFFPRRTVWPDHFRIYQQELRDRGFSVRGREHDRPAAYATLGDVVYMMVIAPWEIEGFDPVAEIDALVALEDALRTPDGIVLTESRDLIEAVKGA